MAILSIFSTIDSTSRLIVVEQHEPLDNLSITASKPQFLNLMLTVYHLH